MKTVINLILSATAFCIITSNCINADEIRTKTADEIKKAAKKAKPGDVILMADGVWKDAQIVFESEGTKEKPVILKAETPGKVILNGDSRLKIAGKYLVVDGLYFKDGFVRQEAGKGRADLIEFRKDSKKTASWCRLTNTKIEDYNPPSDTLDYKWVSVFGDHNRVDHCSFSGKNHQGTTLVVWLSEEPNYCQIDSNYFGFRPELGRNGAETIRIGTSDWSMHFSNTVVEHNYFYRCNGEREIISNKSFGNLYMHNTFVECQGALTLRHGNQCLVEGNFFFGNGVENTGGVRIIGENHKVINNYFEGLRGHDVFSALAIMNGVPNSPLNRYFQVKNAFVAFNTFVNNRYNITIGTGKSEELSLPPTDCIIANNVITGTETEAVTLISQPENFKWQGNIFSVKKTGLPETEGIKTAEVKMSKSSDGLFRPASDSPAKGAAEGSYSFVSEDIDGQPRRDRIDAGCDQISDSPVTERPMKPEETGVRWKAAAASNENMSDSPALNRAPGELIIYNGAKLAELRSKLALGEYSAVLKKIKRDGDKALSAVPVSVMDKQQVPPSGSKHDYLSQSKYWFADPSKPDGKPYIRKDGEVNPETNNFPDHNNFSLLARNVQALSLAYMMTGSEKYAEHAVKMLDTWFLNPDTRMNPNMTYAQLIPGRDAVRGTGIIDIHRLPELIECITFIKGSQHWTKEKNEAMNKWLADFLEWLKTSKNGKDEAKAKNNHGTWYEFQLAYISLYLGRSNEAKNVLTEKVMPRIAAQIETDGKQPFELVRTRALSYSMFNIEAIACLGLIGDRVGIDLWNYKTADGRGLKTAIDYVMPYLTEDKKWEHQQILELKPDEFYSLVKILSLKYPGDPLIRKYLDKFNSEKKTDKAELMF